MRKSRFTEAQIIGMIKEQEAGMPTAEVCRKHGLSQGPPPAFFIIALGWEYSFKQDCFRSQLPLGSVQDRLQKPRCLRLRFDL